MSFQQLDPPMPVHVLDKGDGFAIAVIDYGQEHNLIWVTALNDSGEIWCSPNPAGADAGQLDDGPREVTGDRRRPGPRQRRLFGGWRAVAG